MDKPIVFATNFMEQSESVVASAERLGGAVLRFLEEQETVTVSLAGLRGVSSSYFNVLLGAVVDEHGLDALDSRLVFKFDSMTQKLVLERSILSIRQQYAAA